MKTSTKVEIGIPLLLVISDCIAVLLSYLISYELRFFTFFDELLPRDTALPEIEEYIIFSLIILPIWVIVFQSYKMYRLKRVVFIFDELSDIVKASTVSVIFAMALVFFYREYSYSRVVFVMSWFFAIILITIFRYLVLKFEKTLYNNNIGVKRVAIVGVNDISEKIYKKLCNETFLGLHFVGYFTKNNTDESGITDLKRIGSYDNLPVMIRKEKIDNLIVALKSEDHGDVFPLIKKCEGLNIEFMFAPDYFNILTSKLKIEELEGIPFMKLKSIPLNIWKRIVKRLFDIITASILIFIFSPVMLIIAVLVKFTSPGPVFYRQERVGLDGVKFNMIKFRSMIVDAEKEGPKFADEQLSRYTVVGKWLRKYSLDELPQFFNVLNGSMSMVGPRPEREFFINQLKDEIDNFLERHRVKAGVTGWSQVNGLRGAKTSYQTRIEYDIYYIENWSLAFDIKIIFKTLKEMLFSKEAF